jgi:hypothetical protein
MKIILLILIQLIVGIIVLPVIKIDSATQQVISSSVEIFDPANPDSTLRPVYRFFNKKTGTWLYTSSKSEKEAVLNLIDEWNYEGEKFSIHILNVKDTVPVYRFFNTILGGHIMTINENERQVISTTLKQFNFEGIKFYVYTSESIDLLKVYRFFDTEVGNHLFTSSVTEKNEVSKINKFVEEQSGFWVKGI